jgi:CHAD domain-containing protein
VGKALEALGGGGRRLSDEAVHDVRKRLKKVRAGLRLLREALGPGLYRRENASFRDAARPLTEVRDAKVLVETLDALAGHDGGDIDPKVRSGVRQALLHARREVRQCVLGDADALKAVEESLHAAKERAADWPVGRRGWSVLGEGLKRVYKAGRDAYRLALDEPLEENLHEWRKQAKYLWHQLEVLRPVWPEVMEDLAERAHDLSHYLGDDHDLAVLRQTLLGGPAPIPDPAALALLVGQIDRRRAELQEQARALGRRLYEEKPKRFARRLEGYWRAWRAEAPVRA